MLFPQSDTLNFAEIIAIRELNSNPIKLRSLIQEKIDRISKAKELLLTIYGIKVDETTNSNHINFKKKDSNCNCTLCRTVKEYTYVKRQFHWFKKSFFNEEYTISQNSNFFNSCYATEAIWEEDDLNFFTRKSEEFKSSIKKLRMSYKSIEDSVNHLLEIAISK